VETETVTVKELHQNTKSVLDQVEQGATVVVTRSGRPIVRLERIKPDRANSWDEIMREVWAAQNEIKRSELQKNPVLEERRRRRR
jgi:antitoxin (DNA-binding transcriptional repressor) of toxin-antitoxin stability system